MPQMMPMNWLILFMFFLIILFLFLILNYYNFFLQKNLNKNILNKNMKIMNWKW